MSSHAAVQVHTTVHVRSCSVGLYEPKLMKMTNGQPLGQKYLGKRTRIRVVCCLCFIVGKRGAQKNARMRRDKKKEGNSGPEWKWATSGHRRRSCCSCSPRLPRSDAAEQTAAKGSHWSTHIGRSAGWQLDDCRRDRDRIPVERGAEELGGGGGAVCAFLERAGVVDVGAQIERRHGRAARDVDVGRAGGDGGAGICQRRIGVVVVHEEGGPEWR